MKIKVFQKGFNYSQDGPGNRLVYHLQGCNMRCPWCANAEGIPPDGTLIVESGMLLDSVCPRGAIENRRLNRVICTGCENKICLTRRTRGIRLSCTEYDTDELLTEVLRSRALFFDNGGVTFTGGEPTCQFNPLRELLEKLKASGVHTAIETNATHRKLTELLPLLDAVIMDFKHWDDAVLHEATGVDSQIIRQNLELMIAAKYPVSVRIPLIDGFNASQKDLDGFLAYFDTLDFERCTLELLPFHEYGRDKWEKCGLEYTMQGGKVTGETANLFRTEFIAHGVRVVKT